MSELQVHVLRGGHVESLHEVSVAVVDAAGTLLAASGDPDLVTFWRSCAKPFQVLPLVEDGGVERFGLGDAELALACASHSSEPVHLALTDGFLARIGCAERDLACGPHPPLGPAVAQEVARAGITLTPRWSNCSGKHAGLLALARLHGWPTEGYERWGHPVQDRVAATIARWTDVPVSALRTAVDGCTAVCFGLPLRNQALAYARLATTDDPALSRIRGAMTAHPELVAGEGRCCTDCMRAAPGLIVKVGAEGLYCAALPGPGWGVALKVHDGDMRVAPLAIVAVLRRLSHALPGAPMLPEAGLEAWEELPVHNTRGALTGRIQMVGTLRFSEAAG